MTPTNSLLIRAYLQLLLLVVIVFGIGCYKRDGLNFDGINLKSFTFWDSSDKDKTSTTVAPTRLMAVYTSANAYPEVKFLSDGAWKNYVSTSTYPRYDGKGNIGTDNVGFNIELRPNGTMVGRYYNANGTLLDFNGYINSSTGDLHIHLGHGKELSDWTLTPVSSESSRSRYVYEGTWGRRNKPSRIIITPES